MESYVVRLWLPDRPGALGQVASRIGAVRGEIVGIEILERGGGRAIDELVVDLPEPGLEDLLVQEIQQVDGVDVEEIRPARRRPPRSRGSTRSRRRRCSWAPPTRDELTRAIVVHARRAVGAEWAAVVDLEDGAILAAEGPVPSAGLAGRPSWKAAALGPGGRRARPAPTTWCGRRCRRSASPWSSVATAPPIGRGSDDRWPPWPGSSTPASARSSAIRRIRNHPSMRR